MLLCMAASKSHFMVVGGLSEGSHGGDGDVQNGFKLVTADDSEAHGQVE